MTKFVGFVLLPVIVATFLSVLSINACAKQQLDVNQVRDLAKEKSAGYVLAEGVLQTSVARVTCNNGRVEITLAVGSQHKTVHLQEQAVCGKAMDQLAAATLRIHESNPNFNTIVDNDWLYWAAARSGLENPGLEKVPNTTFAEVQPDPWSHLSLADRPDWELYIDAPEFREGVPASKRVVLLRRAIGKTAEGLVAYHHYRIVDQNLRDRYGSLAKRHAARYGVMFEPSFEPFMPNAR